jgi:hypothetical protein
MSGSQMLKQLQIELRFICQVPERKYGKDKIQKMTPASGNGGDVGMILQKCKTFYSQAFQTHDFLLLKAYIQSRIKRVGRTFTTKRIVLHHI